MYICYVLDGNTHTHIYIYVCVCVCVFTYTSAFRITAMLVFLSARRCTTLHSSTTDTREKYVTRKTTQKVNVH